jgi:signal transduction histidine kinase
MLPDDVHVALYRIAQETLNNVMKHAHAERVKVTLQCSSWPARMADRPLQEVTLQVSDDGRGFDPHNLPPDRLGLEIIRERAQAIGAALRIESKPDKGTTVTAVWKG